VDDWRGSVFPRKGKLCMALKIDGKWKQVPTPYYPGQEDEARKLLKRTREFLRAGEDAGLGPSPTVAEYVKHWLVERKTVVKSWDDDESRLNTHVLPAIGALSLADVRPRHVLEMMTKVRAKGLAPRTVRNVYAVVQAVFRKAKLADLYEGDPCILTHHELGKIRDARHEWRAGAIFSADELRSLLFSPKIPQDRRVLYGLASLGCLRHGEAAGLRWRHYVSGLQPLGRLIVSTSYDVGTTKSEAERWMPVHRDLAALLGEWKLSGWAGQQGRAPKADDLVVPHPQPTNRGPRVLFGGMRSDHDSYKRLRIDLLELGLRARRFHDLRRAGITLYREGGADREVLRLCTHRPTRDVMELYTSFGWAKLCEAILCGLLCGVPASRRVKK
jgi:integrase